MRPINVAATVPVPGSGRWRDDRCRRGGRRLGTLLPCVSVPLRLSSIPLARPKYKPRYLQEIGYLTGNWISPRFDSPGTHQCQQKAVADSLAAPQTSVFASTIV
jgi:hypothetical protein